MNGYKEALSVNVFHTMGRICCMEDTIGLGKFFTRAVTAYEERKYNIRYNFLRPIKQLIKTNRLQNKSSVYKKYVYFV